MATKAELKSIGKRLNALAHDCYMAGYHAMNSSLRIHTSKVSNDYLAVLAAEAKAKLEKK